MAIEQSHNLANPITDLAIELLIVRFFIISKRVLRMQDLVTFFVNLKAHITRHKSVLDELNFALDVAFIARLKLFDRLLKTFISKDNGS